MAKNDFDIDFDFEKEYGFDPKAILDSDFTDDDLDLTEFDAERLGIDLPAKKSEHEFDFDSLNLDDMTLEDDDMTLEDDLASEEDTILAEDSVDEFGFEEDLDAEEEALLEFADEEDAFEDEFAEEDYDDDADLTADMNFSRRADFFEELAFPEATRAGP